MPDGELPLVLARWRRAVLAGEYRATSCVDPDLAMAVIRAAREQREQRLPWRYRVVLRVLGWFRHR